MTIDDFAAASQQEFTAIRNEMATKEGLHQTETNILRAIEGVDLHLASYASRWTEDLTKLHDWVKEHEERLRFLEKAQVKK